MRVVINATCAAAPRTGVGHYTAELIRALAATGEVGVSVYPHPALARLRTRLGGGPRAVAPSPNGPGVSQRKLVRQVMRSPLRAGWRALGWLEARRAFSPRRADLYHEPNFFPLPTRLPTVVTVHDLSAVLYPHWHPADRVAEFETKFLPRIRDVAHLLTDSDHARGEILRTLGLPPDRVTRAYPGVRAGLGPLPAGVVGPAVRRLGLPPTYLLHVGALEPRKNLLMLLRAYLALPAGLRERCPLVLVGPWGWRFEELAALYAAEGRHKNVIHLGYVPEAALAAVYNGARALVYPTHYEGFGLPAAEMLACGGAVIASSTPAVAEVVGPCGTLLDPADEGGWHAATAKAIREPDWAASLARGSVERAARFTWDACARDTLAGYRAALSGPPLPPLWGERG